MVRYDSTTALVVVDMQNDFADPNGSLFVAGGDGLVGPVNAEIIRAAAVGGPVVYTQDWHPESTPHFQKDGGIWPVHCVGGTWGAALHPELVVAGPRVRKGTGGEDGYSGFTVRDPQTGGERATGLADLLRSRGVARAVVCGLALDYCVGETAADAARLGFGTALLTDLTAAVELQTGDGAAMLARLEGLGVDLLGVSAAG